jgi:hypothetical protein
LKLFPAARSATCRFEPALLAAGKKSRAEAGLGRELAYDPRGAGIAFDRDASAKCERAPEARER